VIVWVGWLRPRRVGIPPPAWFVVIRWNVASCSSPDCPPFAAQTISTIGSGFPAVEHSFSHSHFLAFPSSFSRRIYSDIIIACSNE
jgi:hypothetical protein